LLQKISQQRRFLWISTAEPVELFLFLEKKQTPANYILQHIIIYILVVSIYETSN